MHRVRRYLPFYVGAVAWLLMVWLVPTTAPRSTGVQAGTQSIGTLPPEQGGTGAPGDASGPGGAGGSGATGGASARGAGPGGAASGVSGTGGAVATGVTRLGATCQPGVRQLPDSNYAPPCRSVFKGDNGGATSRGVSATEIKVVSREYADTADQRAVESQAAAAGFPPREVRNAVRKVFVDYFNKSFELYGRKVALEQYQSNANSVEEVRNEGREVACADATAIAQERKAFAIVPPSALIGLGPLSECAAQQQLFVPIGPYGFPESFYRRYHPYIWGTQMVCDRIAHLLSEYTGKQLANRPAKWARDPAYVGQVRKIGYIAPNISAYADCVDLIKKDIKAKYGVTFASTFSYGVDPSTMPQQAAQAVVQFKQAGVTTILLAADFLMTTNMTLQARQQDWGPEWVISSAGLTDVDNLARAFDQDRVAGHLFGITPLGDGRYTLGQDGEAARLYKRLTGQPLPTGMAAEYSNLLQVFTLLQSAGPDLTVANIATGAFSLPAAVGIEGGRASFRTAPDGTPNVGDHTSSDDVREVYWSSTAPGADGKPGSYIGTYGDRRLGHNDFPREEPPNYPSR
jgi:hypothetical protein